jgi:hypothetical protein
MTKKLIYLILINSCYIFSQQQEKITANQFILTPEVMLGITIEPNSNFPNHKLQKQLFINLGWKHDKNLQEWAQRLKGPRTGISIGYSDFGNTTNLGSPLTAMPFIEFNAFKKEKLKIQLGSGISYFNKKYDSISNPNNQAVTTDLTWSLRAFMHYQLSSTETIDWRIGAGYFHHSNGHTFIPNQGYNSFLISFSADIKNLQAINNNIDLATETNYDRSIYTYFSLRFGYGKNALSKSFNDKKDVFTYSADYGKVLNHTLKLGVGFYYRFYENYYDYINNNESLVQDGREFDHFKRNPKWYGSNIGLSLNAEILLNHFGIDYQLGFNLHKPGYKIDWRINEGWSYVPRVIPEESPIVLGKFNTYYHLKKLISFRMGLKYYLIGTKNNPKTNVYIGAFINANLGQADFNELSLGYIYSFNFKKRKNK